MPSEESKTPNTRRKKAVALRYTKDDQAPRVVASGAGEIARRIVELAESHNVPVREDDSLVDILGKLDVGYEIPTETYQAVAEILAFLYRTDEAWRAKRAGSVEGYPENLPQGSQAAENAPSSSDSNTNSN